MHTHTEFTQINIKHTHLDVQEEARHRAGNTDFQQIVKLRTTPEKEGSKKKLGKKRIGEKQTGGCWNVEKHLY